MTEPVRIQEPRNPFYPESPGSLGLTRSTPQTKSIEPDEILSAGANQLVEANLTRRSTAGTALPPNDLGEWLLHKAEAEVACLLPGDLALRAALLSMDDSGLAQKMLTHFVSGESAPVVVDLDAEFDRNPQLKEYVASRIEFDMALRTKRGETVDGMTGAVWVPQDAYGESDAGRDQKNALGGTFFEYQVTGSASTQGWMVQVSVSDHYFWSPSETERPTHCLHERGAELVAVGRSFEFHQFGEGTLHLNDPTVGAPMLPSETREISNE